jgi:hypothetical protein
MFGEDVDAVVLYYSLVLALIDEYSTSSTRLPSTDTVQVLVVFY